MTSIFFVVFAYLRLLWDFVDYYLGTLPADSLNEDSGFESAVLINCNFGKQNKHFKTKSDTVIILTYFQKL